jgi:GTPase SAR1 family protein
MKPEVKEALRMARGSFEEVDRLGRETGSVLKKRKHMSDDAKFNVAMIGHAGCGKSSVTVRFVRGIFEEEYNPTVRALPYFFFAHICYLRWRIVTAKRSMWTRNSECWTSMTLQEQKIYHMYRTPF